MQERWFVKLELVRGSTKHSLSLPEPMDMENSVQTPVQAPDASTVTSQI